MRKIFLTFIMLCILCTQVFGSFAHEGEHKHQGDFHSFLHEIGHPHSHDHDDDGHFKLSFSHEAVKHINQDIDCSSTAILPLLPISFLHIKPIAPIESICADWSPPFLKNTTPPPKA